MTGNTPDPWGALHEDARTYTTLATALIGITATFSSRFVIGPGGWRLLFPIIGWAALAASIGCCTYANGRIFAGMKRGDDATTGSVESASSGKKRPAKYNGAAGWLNGAVISLVIGTMILAVLAVARTGVSTETSTQLISAARATASVMANLPESDAVIQSVTKDSENRFTIEVAFAGEEEPVIVVTILDGELLTAHRST